MRECCCQEMHQYSIRKFKKYLKPVRHGSARFAKMDLQVRANRPESAPNHPCIQYQAQLHCIYLCFLIDFEVYFWIHNDSILDTQYISNHTSLVDTRMHNLLTFNFLGFNLFIESLLFIWTDMTTEIERSLRGNATLNTHLNV